MGRSKGTLWAVFMVLLIAGSSLAATVISDPGAFTGQASPLASPSTVPTPPSSSPALNALLAPYSYLSEWPTSTQALIDTFDRAMPFDTNLNGVIPWGAFMEILNESRAGTLTQAKAAAILVAATGGGIDLEGALFIVGVSTAVGCAVGAVIGCLAGAIVGAAIVGFDLLLNYYNGGNYERASAVIQADTMLGSLANVLALNENATRTEEAALNLTSVALDYQAANAALLQLGNASFNPQLDAIQSDLLPGIYSVFEADILDIQGIIVAEFNQFDNTFGGNGFYGAQGIVCQFVSKYQPGGGFYVGEQSFAAPYVDGGYSGNVGGCLGESGTPSWGVYSSAGTAGSAAGIQVNLHNGFGTSGSPSYIQHDSPLFFGGGTSTSTYPWTTIQLRPLLGFGTSWFNVSGQVGQVVNYTGPTGAYYISSEECTSAVIATCTAVGGATRQVTSGNVWPVIGANLATVSIGGWFNVTTDTPDNGLVPIYNAVWECTSGASVLTTAFAVNTGSNGGLSAGVNACGAGTDYLATELNNILIGAENVAGTYWSFLTNQGYTSESQVPARCIVPTVSDALPSWTPQQLAEAGVANLTKIYYAYLLQLGYTFNASASLTNVNFCGAHVKTPVGGWASLFGAPLPVNATGDIYIPNATGQTPPGSTPTLKQTVVGTGYGSAEGLAPLTTVTTHEVIVVVAASYEASVTSVNDSLGNTFAKMSVGNGAGGYAAVFVDNATTAAGSTDYLTVHAGSATYWGVVAYLFKASEVYNVSWGPWENPPPSASKVTWASPSGSLSISGLVGTGGPFSNVTVPSAATACVNATDAAKAQTMACSYATTSTPTSHVWGFGTSGWGTSFGISVTAGGGGPAIENISNPLTWNLTNVEFTIVPGVASMTVGMNAVWSLAYDNPSSILVAGTANDTALPVFGGAPFGFLSNVEGNSSVQWNGSAYPAHTSSALLGNGYAVDILTCQVTQPSGSVSTYVSACPFQRDTLVGYYTNYTCLVFGDCATPPIPAPAGSGCGGPYLSWLAGPIAGPLESIPILGSVGCALAEVIAVIILIVIVIVVVWAVAAIVRAARGRR